MKIVALIACVVLMGAGPTSQPTTGPSELQAERVKLINKLVKEGVFGEIVIQNRIVKVIARPRFHALEFDTKQKFCSVIYAWAVEEDSTCDLLVLKDSQTGNRIGRFGPAYGGLKMD